MRSLSLLFGALFFCAGCWFLQQGLASLKWPEMPGKIVRSVTAESLSESDGPSAHSPGYFRAVVEYTYPIIDREKDPYARVYFSDRIFMGIPIFASYRDSEAWTAQYQEGDIISVRTHPTQPRRSVLNPGIHWPTILTCFAPALLLFAFAGALSRPKGAGPH